MNNKIILVVIILSTLTFLILRLRVESQNVYMKPVFCDTEGEAHFFDLGNTKVYLLENMDTIQVSTDEKSVWRNYFKGKGQDKYLISYENIFNQRLDTIIEVEENSTQIALCVDMFKPDNSITLFKQAVDSGYTWELIAEESGCFHSDNFSIKIYKDEAIEAFFIEVETWGYFKLKNLLGGVEYERLDLFEKKLRSLNNDGYCTTRTKFNIISNNKKFSIKYDACGVHFSFSR